ncbi:arylesterase [Chitinimonas sp. BJB300]|uniref:arylesterase n=1 Tax=Chitinimonas sp. BJB300 TaxID=1559339 RepID=UPI000C0CBC44|nr:arylesterase [Chitinimonas sp. BJB300]PHV12496.1 arylesterase [Chitinimonas sp. BJB300]TSJ89115.1 arylesterase [Chitinimonas sp. BJB300]
MTTRRSTLILIALLLLFGCGKQPKLNRLANDATILAFGDSLTFGTGATPETSYPTMLASLIARPVINAGVPGNTTADGLTRFAATLDATPPRLVILCLGGNDFLQRKPQEETIANLRAMLDEAKRRNLPVLLVATPKLALGLKVPDFYAELAKEYQLPLESESLVRILADNKLKSDPIHPNAEGYRQLAEALAERLRKAGAVANH